MYQVVNEEYAERLVGGFIERESFSRQKNIYSLPGPEKGKKRGHLTFL